MTVRTRMQPRPLLYVWLPLVAWMGLIFFLSAQPDLPHPQGELLDLLFSSMAHGFVFGVLAVLWMRALGEYKHGLLVAFALTMLYALSDEFHQTFVPGRCMDPWDLLCDALGAVAALAIWSWIQRRKGRREEKGDVMPESGITVQNIDRVLAFLPILEDPEAVLYTIQTQPLTMDPYLYSDEVIAFVGLLSAEGFVVPFDWPAWQDEARRLVDEPALIASADLVTLQKLLTTHVRAERFVSGHLAAMLDNGHIVAILKRLEALRAEWVKAG